MSERAEALADHVTLLQQEIERLRAQLATLQAERDAWKQDAEASVGYAVDASDKIVSLEAECEALRQERDEIVSNRAEVVRRLEERIAAITGAPEAMLVTDCRLRHRHLG